MNEAKTNTPIQVIPAILRRTWEGIQEDWQKVAANVPLVQIDVTDGVFAGDGSFREIRRFKQLPHSRKIELHMMVQDPPTFVDDIIDLNPARCIFHLEAFSGGHLIRQVYTALRKKTQTQLALGINPQTPTEWLEEYLPLLDYVLFMGYEPGWAGQKVDQSVYRKIGAFRDQYPEMLIAVDGNVNKETLPFYVRAGARVLCANSSIFKDGNPLENHRQLTLLTEESLAPVEKTN